MRVIPLFMFTSSHVAVQVWDNNDCLVTKDFGLGTPVGPFHIVSSERMEEVGFTREEIKQLPCTINYDHLPEVDDSQLANIRDYMQKIQKKLPWDLENGRWENGPNAKLMGIGTQLQSEISNLKRTEERLRKFIESSAATNRCRNLFVDIISHDLINPLMAIRLTAEHLMDGETDHDKEMHLATINRSASRAEEMVQNAILLSKLESQEHLDHYNLDLSEIMNSLIQDFEQQLREKDISVAFNPLQRCAVKANPIIENIFSNLLSNAIRYSPEGSEVEIDIKDNEMSWVVVFKDSGEGVPEKYRDSIFERFNRGEKKGIKGTGLGLAIAKRIVELHEGAIWVEDNPGGGSVFCVSLPKENLSN